MTLTKNDIVKIDERIGIRLEDQKEELLEQIDQKLQGLKSDFFEKINPILNEVKTARDERPLIIKRIEKIENKLQLRTS